LNYLENIWKEIWTSFNSDEKYINKLWYEIEKAYSSKSRYYHNLDHIKQMILASEKYSEHIIDLKTLRLAIFYHDIVYSVKSKKNEEQSAIIAEKKLIQLNYPVNLIENCIQYIHATKTHHNLHNNGDLAFLLDFDLEILGSAWPVYFKYSRQIRKEYKIYPDILYNEGRRKVLTYFLNLKSIFKTKEYIEKFEQIARQNLSGELDLLK
jgi:predicted metal-dependent HD superfamily phosphohydrolase